METLFIRGNYEIFQSQIEDIFFILSMELHGKSESLMFHAYNKVYIINM